MTKRTPVGFENYDDVRMLDIRKNFHKKYVKPLVNMDAEIINNVDFNGEKRILDLGCGYGDLLSSIKKRTRGCELLGVDISGEMIINAKKLCKGVKFSVADAQGLPFKKDYFDIVICKHILCHVTDIQKAMNEIRRVLKKDGIVVIVQNTLANKSKMHTERYRQYVAKELGRSYLDTNHRFNIENYTNYITGFRILKEERMFGYFISPDPGPLIDYISSMKDFYVPIPKKEEWNEVINKLKILITREISGKKLFEEVVGTGMVLLQKV